MCGEGLLEYLAGNLHSGISVASTDQNGPPSHLVLTSTEVFEVYRDHSRTLIQQERFVSLSTSEREPMQEVMLKGLLACIGTGLHSYRLLTVCQSFASMLL